MQTETSPLDRNAWKLIHIVIQNHSLYTTSLYLVMFRLDLKIFFLNGCSPKYPVWQTTYPKVKIVKIRRCFCIIHNAQTKGTVGDPEFSWGRTPTLKVGLLTYYFGENCRKMEGFGPRGSLVPPLDPPLQYINGDGCTSWSTYSIVSFSCTHSGTFVIWFMATDLTRTFKEGYI